MSQDTLKYAVAALRLAHGIGNLTIACIAVFCWFRWLIEYRGPFQLFALWVWRKKNLTERGVYYRNKMLRFVVYFFIWAGGGGILLSILDSFFPAAQ